MELKHKECFIPNIINYYDLQSISKYAREAAEFVNLYSKWRGINRFPALMMAVDLHRRAPGGRSKSGVEDPGPDRPQAVVRVRRGAGQPGPGRSGRRTGQPES